MLKGERLLLRATEKADIEAMTRHKNDLETRSLADDDPPLPISLEEMEADYERRLQGEKSDSAWFSIEADGKCIGGCGLFLVKRYHGTAQLGICIGDKDYWAKGYGREAIGLLLGYGFRYLNLRRIWLTVIDGNDRAYRCYQSCGFVEEGRQREHEWCVGEYRDLIYMGVLATEWSAAKRLSKE